MARSRPALRRAAVQAHLWLGLVIGLLWSLQGLTGAYLVFHREIDRLGLPAAVAGPMAPMERLVLAVEQEAGAPVTRIGIADARGDLLTAAYEDGAGAHRALLVDAATARVVAAREDEPATPFAGSFSRWVYTLHEALVAGERGEMLVGVSGILLFTAALTGLWLGWPRRQAWRAAFAARRWRSAAQILFGWHRMLGLVAGLVMLVTIPAGAWMIFQAELRPALARAVPMALPYQPAPSLVIRPISPDQALAAARARFPEAGFVRLTFPTPKSPAYVVRLRQPAEVRAWSGVTSVAVDAGSGRVVHVYDPLRAPLANRLADAAYSAHSGELAGCIGRLLVFLMGLSLPSLYVTGLLAWARKRRARHRSTGRLAVRPLLNSA